MKSTGSNGARCATRCGCFKNLTNCFKLRNTVGVNQHEVEDLNARPANHSSEENNETEKIRTSENKHDIGNNSS